MEEQAGQAEEVDQVLWDLIRLLLQPGEHSLGLQEELWKDVDRRRLTTRSHPKKGGNSRKDGQVVLVCSCLFIQSDLVISYLFEELHTIFVLHLPTMSSGILWVLLALYMQSALYPSGSGPG